MTTAVDDCLRHAPPPESAERRLRTLAYLGVGLFAAYLGATLAEARASTLSIVFSLVVVPVPVAAWWAYTKAQGRLRLPVLLLASAATLWLLGALVWQGFDIANGNKVPAEPGVWDALFVTARLLVIAALVVALRSLISFRVAVFDACVVIAAGLAIGAPFVHDGLEHGATVASIVTLNLPLLSIVTLMLIVSAAMGSWEGLPRSMAMLGFAEVPLMVGNLIYGYQAVQGTYDDDRWADLCWAAGAIMVVLAASVIILGIDRPVRLPAHPRIPGQPPGARSVLLFSLGALSLSLGVASYGLLIESRGLALVGLVTSVAIAVAMALRARDSMRAAQEAYARLDRALIETEQAKDELALANDELNRANTEIRAMQIAFVDTLNLADKRTQGRIRALIERTGRDLTAILEEHLEEK